MNALIKSDAGKGCGGLHQDPDFEITLRGSFKGGDWADS